MSTDFSAGENFIKRRKKRGKIENNLLFKTFHRNPRYFKNGFKLNHQYFDKWFDIINIHVFDGELEPFYDVAIVPEMPCWATTVSYFVDDIRFSELQISSVFPNVQYCLTTIAHEMVHAFQWQELGISDHGPSFWAWQKDFDVFGIPLALEM